MGQRESPLPAEPTARPVLDSKPAVRKPLRWRSPGEVHSVDALRAVRILRALPREAVGDGVSL